MEYKTMEYQTKRPLVIPVLLLIIAYEWLIASVDKLLTKNLFKTCISKWYNRYLVFSFILMQAYLRV